MHWSVSFWTEIDDNCVPIQVLSIEEGEGKTRGLVGGCLSGSCIS